MADAPALARALEAQLADLLPERERPAGAVVADLVGEIDQTVALLDTPEALVRQTLRLARSAAAAGIPATDYERMIEALLLALEARLGARLDLTAHATWLAACSLIVALMRRFEQRAASGTGPIRAADPRSNQQ